MAILTRSSVAAIIPESVEGTLEDLTAGGEYIPLRDGFAVTNELETLDSDELINDIGKSKGAVVGQNPKISHPFYVKHSGVEGTAPETAPIYKSCLGAQVDNATEYDTVAGSTVDKINVDTGEGVNFPEGMAVLVKNATDGYEVRNIDSVVTDALALAFNLANAPASGVDLGKCIAFSPASTGHPVFSYYRNQASTSSAFREAISGLRTTNMAFEFPAKGFATCTADAEGLKYYFNFLKVTALNKYIDITDDSGTITVTLTEKVYKTPQELESEITTKATAASVGSGDDVITCVYSNITGKFSLSSDGSTFSLLWKTGTHGADGTDTSAAALLGYADAADDTGSTSYPSDTAQTYEADYTPIYDVADKIVLKNAEWLIGGATSVTCKPASTVTLALGTPKTDVNSICAENGKAETLTLEREVTLTGNVILSKYDAELFDTAINNTTTKSMFNAGPKDASGNWIPGNVFNMFMQSATITSTPIQDENGYTIIALEAKGHITSGTKDIFINFL